MTARPAGKPGRASASVIDKVTKHGRAAQVCQVTPVAVAVRSCWCTQVGGPLSGARGRVVVTQERHVG